MTKKVLADHQTYALEMMDANDSLANFYAPGCGKTAIALSWINRAYRDGRIRNALVVCPASLVGNWERSIETASDFEGISEEDVKVLKRIIHVTSFQKVYKTTRKEVHHKDGQVTCKRTIALRPEVDCRWGVVIVDESHCIGAHNSVQTRACLTLSKLADHRYIMTGTPVAGGKGKEDFAKLYGQLKFLDDKVWSSWTDFCNRYVTAFDKWFKPVSYDIRACRALMQEYGIVARLEDCRDMPPKTDTMIPCDLAEKKVYNDIKKGNVLPYGIDIEAAGTQYIKLLQICSGSMKRGPDDIMKLKTSKADALKDIIEGTDDKIVIFCNYTASIDLCADICRKAGRTTVVYDGRSKGNTWMEFQFGSADAIVCQYQKGGPGLDLYASHTMVLFEPCLSALLLEQSRARIWRTGQENHCNYLYLYTPNTMESKVLTTVREGVDVTNKMLEQWAHGELDDL